MVVVAKEYSPFTPGQPVPVEFFVGRLAEVEDLRQRVKEAAQGRFQVAFLTGERGIGKSSLASFVRFASEKDEKVLGLHTFLGGVSSLEEMARRVFDRLLKESLDKSWFEKVKAFLGNNIREVGLFGVTVEFGAPEKDLRRLVSDFLPALRNLMERLAGEKAGLLVILDDINGLADSADFANWLKSLVDEVATSGKPCPLFLLLVGLEERRQSLIALQPSLARVFDLIEIRPWTQPETVRFFKDAFSKVGVTADDDALDTLARYAGGLPMLAHEIGDAVFKADSDNRVDGNDAIKGVIAAADVVGRKHLEPQLFQAIRSQKYRAILRKVAETPLDLTFRRSDLLSRLSTDEKSVLDNFLTRMKKLGAIQPDGEPGEYKFSNQLHRLYFWLEAERAKGQ